MCKLQSSLPPERVEHRSGPALFVAFPGMTRMTRMTGMTQMNSERLYSVSGHAGLATVSRKVMPTNYKRFLLIKNAAARQCYTRTPRFEEEPFVLKKTKRRGNASPARATLGASGAEPKFFYPKVDFQFFFWRCLVGL